MLEPLTTSFNIVGSGLSALKQIQDSYNRLKSSFKTTEVESKNSFGKMKTYANSFFNTMQRGVVKVGTGFKTMMARSALSFKNFMGSFLGKALLIGSILGVGIGVGSMINEYRQFDDIMLQTKAIAGATETQYVSLREQAKELGRTTRFEAFQVAEAQKYQAVAGWKVNEILKATPAIMDLAAASGENLGTVSDIVTDSMTAFKWAAKDAAKFTDILAATATSTNTNISMLGESFKYVSPMASALGESVESTATYLGMLANAGIKGSMAGTSLNQVFSSLLNPTDEVNASLYRMGVNLKDSKGNFVGLQSIFKSLRAGLKGMGEFEQAATLNKIFGERGGRAVLTILKSTNEEFNSLFSKIKNSEGATKKMADIMNSGFGGAMDRFKSSASGLKLEIMEIISKPMAKWFDSSAKKMDDWTKKINPLFKQISGFVEENKAGLMIVGTIIGFALNPMFTLISLIVIAYNKFDWFKNIVDLSFKFIIFAIQGTVVFFQELYNTVVWIGQGLKDYLIDPFLIGSSFIIESIGNIIESVIDFKNSFDNTFQFIATMFLFLTNPIAWFITGLNFITGGCTDLKGAFKDTFNFIYSAIDYAITKVSELFGWFGKLGEGISNSFEKLKNSKLFKAIFEVDVKAKEHGDNLIRKPEKLGSSIENNFREEKVIEKNSKEYFVNNMEKFKTEKVIEKNNESEKLKEVFNNNLTLEKLTKEKVIEKNNEVMKENIKGSNVTNTSNSSNKTVHNTNTFIIQTNDDEKTKKTIREVLYEEKIKDGEV